MIQAIKHNPVNWTDGMKISERHLLAHDDFIIDTIRDASSLQCNRFNYGLLPVVVAKDPTETFFDVYSTGTNDIQLVIKQCDAVTAAGYRVNLSDFHTNLKPLMKSGEGDEEASLAYYILISVNPFQRVPFGDIDPDEIPPRHPFSKTHYNIEFLSENVIRGGSMGGNYIIIGKVNFIENKPKTDEFFIPPCTSVYSHHKLLAYYRSFAQSMGDLQQYALTINQKAIKANQNTSLALNVKSLCTTLINHIADVYFHYRNIIPQQPPIYMIQVFSSMALHIYNSTQILAAGELEEMLNYSFEWSEIAPHTLLNQLSAVAEINYDHNNSGQHLFEVEKMLSSLVTVFSKLSSLDYIGQQKENIIVNKTDITPKSNSNKGWNLLD